MGSYFDEMVLRCQEVAAVGKATCLNARLNRPSTTSLVACVALTTFTAAAVVWGTTTSASLVVPILLAATSLVAVAYTTYKIYLWVQMPTEGRSREWEAIFEYILCGNFTYAASRLEAIAQGTSPSGARVPIQVDELGKKFSSLDVRFTKGPVDFQRLIADCLACSAASRASYVGGDETEKTEQKIMNWIRFIRDGDGLETNYRETIEEGMNTKFVPTEVKNYVPLLLSSTLYWTDAYLSTNNSDSPDLDNWGDFADTKAYLRAIAPFITEKYVGAENVSIFREMLASQNLREFYVATMKLSRDELSARRVDLRK